MARNRDHLADSFGADSSGGWLNGFLADEDEFDRRAMWRLGTWGAASVAAVIVALMANQSSLGFRREQIAAADLALQSQQTQRAVRENQNETRRLASVVDTLNSDRDRLYSRVSILEQGLDSVTGSIARQASAATSPLSPAAAAKTAEPEKIAAPTAALQVAAPAPEASASDKSPQTTKAPPAAPPTAAAAESPAASAVRPQGSTTAKTSAAAMPTPATPLMASKSVMAPPDPAASKLIEIEPAVAQAPEKPANDAVASLPAKPIAEKSMTNATDHAAVADVTIQRTDFGVDLGSAATIGGLRALWRRVQRSDQALAALRPVIVVKERGNGAGLQLRLVAGPLGDAAEAARICAGLIQASHGCETSVFDGQRLALHDEGGPAATPKPPRKRSAAKRAKLQETAPASPPPRSALSSLLGTR